MMNLLDYQANSIRDQLNWAQSPIRCSIDYHMVIMTLILILILSRTQLKAAFSLLIIDHVLTSDLKLTIALGKSVASQESKGSPVMITMMQ